MVDQVAPPHADAVPAEYFSIILTGAMNPRLHHPYWYRLNGLISEEASMAAMAGQMVVSSEMAQFSTPDFQITCVPNQWEISTSRFALRDEALRIAASVFDDRLHETPFAAIGFVHAFHRSLGEGALCGELLSRMAKSGFGLEEENVVRGTINLGIDSGDGSTTVVVIEPSQRDAASVFVLVHATHVLRTSGRFDLGPVLQRHFAPDFEAAQSIAERIQRTLTAAGVA